MAIGAFVGNLSGDWHIRQHVCPLDAHGTAGRTGQQGLLVSPSPPARSGCRLDAARRPARDARDGP